MKFDPSAKKLKIITRHELNNKFFSKKDIIKKSNDKNIKFSLISSFAIFYDVEDPNSFCKDVEELLDDNGIWICNFIFTTNA